MWVDLSRSLGSILVGLHVLSGLVSPRGRLLHVWLIEFHGQEGSCILMCESLWRDDIIVIASPLLGVIATLDEELA